MINNKHQKKYIDKQISAGKTKYCPYYPLQYKSVIKEVTNFLNDPSIDVECIVDNLRIISSDEKEALTKKRLE